MGKESMTLNMGGRLSDVRRPAVMGIVNATPDSFYACLLYTSDAADEL